MSSAGQELSDSVSHTKEQWKEMVKECRNARLQRDFARHDLKEAYEQYDKVYKERDVALQERDVALQERDVARQELEEARQELEEARRTPAMDKGPLDRARDEICRTRQDLDETRQELNEAYAIINRFRLKNDRLAREYQTYRDNFNHHADLVEHYEKLHAQSEC